MFGLFEAKRLSEMVAGENLAVGIAYSGLLAHVMEQCGHTNCCISGDEEGRNIISATSIIRGMVDVKSFWMFDVGTKNEAHYRVQRLGSIDFSEALWRATPQFNKSDSWCVRWTGHGQEVDSFEMLYVAVRPDPGRQASERNW